MIKAQQVFVDPQAYADDARLKSAFAYLRQHEPVAWVESDDYRPFWAVTKYADVMEVSGRKDVFRNMPRPILTPNVIEQQRRGGGGPRMRTLVHMDGDDHVAHRSIVTDKAESYLGAQVEFNDYFTVIAQDRRRRPTDDLSSIIANATVNGEPLQQSDCLAYFMLIASAGHDTTAAAIAGGLAALLEYPDQLARLRADPTLMASAVDEMMRWVTPNKGFLRNAAEDYELRGVMVRAGQSVLMSYASANFDEEQFDAADRFDIARKPNKHLAFGFGAHFCLGAQLARIEMRTLFTELLSRIDSIELTAPVELKPTVFVGGIKQLQLRYSPA
jgi:cytochrome P450